MTAEPVHLSGLKAGCSSWTLFHLRTCWVGWQQVAGGALIPPPRGRETKRTLSGDFAEPPLRAAAQSSSRSIQVQAVL